MNEETRGSLLCEFEPLFWLGARWHTPGSGASEQYGQLFLSHLDCRAAHQQMDQEKGTPGSLYSGKRSRAGPEIGCPVRTNQND